MKNADILGRILRCYNHFNRKKQERKHLLETTPALHAGNAYATCSAGVVSMLSICLKKHSEQNTILTLLIQKIIRKFS